MVRNRVLSHDVQELVRTPEVVMDVLEQVAGIPRDYLDGKHHKCPGCGGKDRFRLIDHEKGAVFCNRCFNKGNGDYISAVQHYCNLDFNEALNRIYDYLNIPVHRDIKRITTAQKKIVASFEPDENGNLVKHTEFRNNTTSDSTLWWNGYFYEGKPVGNVKREVVFEYCDGAGNPRHLVQRIEYATKPGEKKPSKVCYQYHYDTTESMYKTGEGSLSRVPFNAVELKEATVVYVVEGEKTAVALQKYFTMKSRIPEYVATTTGSSHSWKTEHTAWFRDKDVIIIPDNDKPGREYAGIIYSGLQSVSTNVEIHDLWKGGEYPEGYDVADWLQQEEGIVF